MRRAAAPGGYGPPNRIRNLAKDANHRPAVGAIYLLSEHPPPGVAAVVDLTRCEHLAHHEGPAYLDLQSAPAGCGSAWASKQISIARPFR